MKLKSIYTSPLIWISLLIFVNFFLFNGASSLRNEEPRRAMVAIEMMESGEYMIPHLHGQTYYNKPPVYNWVLSGFFKVFGFNESVVRLPGILSFILTAWFLFKITASYFDKKTRILFSLMFITLADMLFHGTVNAGEIDLFFSLLTCVQVYLIFYYFEKEKWLHLFVISYLFCAIGILTKGLPSLAFQGITLLAYFIYKRRFLTLFYWQHFLGLTIMLSIVGGYLYYFSLSENVMAFIGQQIKEAAQRTAAEKPLIKTILHLFNFPVLILTKTFPWSLFIFPLCFRKVRTVFLQNKLLKFSLVFLLSNILIYWISPDFRSRYVYMFFPYLILFYGFCLVHLNLTPSWFGKTIKSILTVGMFGASVAVIVLPFFLPEKNVFIFSLCTLSGVAIFMSARIGFKSEEIYRFSLSLVTIMLLGRFVFNIAVLPQMSLLDPEQKYERVVADIIEKSDDKMLYFTGPLKENTRDLSIFGEEFSEVQYEIPFELPYQVPYYYYLSTGNVLKYIPAPTEQGVFLVYDQFAYLVEGQKEILYRFEINHGNKEVLLFEVKN
ncbi:MAG: glycosyltransferase family 39 protein [Crocinitomicaceae bacterium]